MVKSVVKKTCVHEVQATAIIVKHQLFQKMSLPEKLKNCSIGDHLKEDCHLTVHTRSTGLNHEQPVLMRYTQYQRS